jgi:hypothetical protein
VEKSELTNTEKSPGIAAGIEGLQLGQKEKNPIQYEAHDRLATDRAYVDN